MSNSSRSRASISKHRGAEISSKLMPPYCGARICTVRTISSTSWVSRQTGQASTSANCLNNAALPSITGSAAAGPILPSPSTAEPSVTTATVFRLIVKRRALLGSSAIAIQIRATPGVYARDKSSRVRSGTFALTSNLPPKCNKKVRSLTLRTLAPGTRAISAVTNSA